MNTEVISSNEKIESPDETAALLIERYRSIRKKSMKENNRFSFNKLRYFFSTSYQVGDISRFEAKFQEEVSGVINSTLQGKNTSEIKKIRLQLKLIHENLSTTMSLITVFTIFMATASALFVTFIQSGGVEAKSAGSFTVILTSLYFIAKRMSFIEHAGICSQLEKFIELEVDERS